MSQTLPWSSQKFTFEEWEAVKVTWKQLVDEQKVVFGKKAPVAKNYRALMALMRKNDQTFADHLGAGLPATSKKYKRLFQAVTRWSQSQEEETSTPD